MKIPTENTKKTPKQQIATWREHIPEKYRGTYDKAMDGHSLRKAINAKCQDCMCWQVAEIRRCTIVTCPLHPYRPSTTRKSRSIESDTDQVA